MRASVINRFAKNITTSQDYARIRRGRRLALALPLAAVAAVGLVGCNNPQHGTNAAQSAQPSVSASVSATPAASASAAVTPGSTATPTAARNGGGIEVSFSGLEAGQQVEAGGSTVSFSVTWTNDSAKTYDHVAPVVATQMYDGAPNRIIPMAAGSLERLDSGVWTKLSLGQGTGMDFATSGDNVVFSLAPGASRTIEYRMHLDVNNGPGLLPIEADAYLRPGAADSFTRLAQGVQKVEVVDHHRS